MANPSPPVVTPEDIHRAAIVLTEGQPSDVDLARARQLLHRLADVLERCDVDERSGSHDPSQSCWENGVNAERNAVRALIAQAKERR